MLVLLVWSKRVILEEAIRVLAFTVGTVRVFELILTGPVMLTVPTVFIPTVVRTPPTDVAPFKNEFPATVKVFCPLTKMEFAVNVSTSMCVVEMDEGPMIVALDEAVCVSPLPTAI